jgi:hypothetical protein
MKIPAISLSFVDFCFFVFFTVIWNFLVVFLIDCKYKFLGCAVWCVSYHISTTAVLYPVLHWAKWAIKLSKCHYPCILHIVKISNFQIKLSMTDVIYLTLLPVVNISSLWITIDTYCYMASTKRLRLCNAVKHKCVHWRAVIAMHNMCNACNCKQVTSNVTVHHW